ncbi:MAG: SUMF1/EgtB/PvdO family nonheme iron enzyme [Spirochaetales bacterium]|nr:SUMF1/EgtB/PvdO family nonheme iron enzyme [Spirochaetales bacterium]
MKKSRILAVLTAMAMGLAVFGCKAETETEYVDKTYAEAVTFTAEDAGDAGVKVSMATKTEGAAIYYTTDGTEPTEKSERYTETVTFGKDTVVKAVAVKKGIENSPVSVAKVSIKTKTVEVDKVYAEAVTFTAEDAGEAGVKVAMATKTEGAAIYYTIDESSESLKYSESLTFSKDTEIKAFAVKEGIENSPISVAKVSIRTKTITEKVYVCAKCQKEYNTAQEAIDCCAETPDTTAPADVTELAAAAKDSSVVLTWKDATDEDIFGYLVSWKAESTGRALVALEKDSLIAAKGQQGCVVTGLTNGTKYIFTVKAMDTSGNKSAGVTVKATPVAVDSKETMKIVLSVPEAKSNTSITVTADITTAAQSVEKVVYKKNGSEVASKLLADSSAISAVKDITDNKRWTFEITATDETANGTYTVAALDSDGREEAAQITIDNFDFTPPAKVKGVTATYSNKLKVIILNWINPTDSDFDHVEISYTSTDSTGDSEKSKAEVVTGTEKTFEGIDGNKSYYTYYIASVDKLGNKSNEVKYNVSVKETVSNVPEGFVKIPATSIDGTENWTPSSGVFVSGRKLEIASFYMSDHPVTRGEYKAVMGEDPSYASAYDKDGNKLTGDDAVKNNPVNYISWYDALVYCNTRSIQEKLTPCYSISGSTKPTDWGTVPTSSDSTWNAATCDFTADGYRLPSEAEWEWAARGGESCTYAGSDDIDEVAWYTENTNDTGTRDVKTKKANAYGLYDMSGNVWEWCWDWYGSISSDTASAGPASGSYRCLRGGSWYSLASHAQVAHRYDLNPNNRNYYYGFRLVRSAQ